jgi:hypothetical protein
MKMTMKTHLWPAATFCYVWLMVGFFLGTLVLIGPAGWLANSLRARGWQQGSEDTAMIALIGAYVLASAAIAFWIFRRMGRCRTSRSRYAIPVALTLAAAVCLWGWMSPARLTGASRGTTGSVNFSGGPEFFFGPYPDRPHIEQLKREGFTALVSLQHPAVVPIEPEGIKGEMIDAQQIGIQFINIPMLPWVSANEDALDKIRQLAKTGKGKYYVHCGLGRDRVNIVKRVLELEGTKTQVKDGYVPPSNFAKMVADGEPWFHRGLVQEIDKDVWLIPYPAQDDYNYLLGGQVKHILLVLDPRDAEQRPWIEEARTVLERDKIPFTFKPVPGDPAQWVGIVEAARTLPRPLAVILPYTRPQPKAVAAKAFLDAFRTQTP